MTTHKQCSKCKARKPVNEFHKNGKDNHHKTRYRARCKQCEAKRDKEKYQKKVTKRITSGERVKISCKTVVEKQQSRFTLPCRKKGAWIKHCIEDKHPAYKHGYCKHPLYGTWINMIQRCHNPDNPDNPSYEHYGERGITVCLRWRESFEAFIKDMGEKPVPSWSLDRVDNDKGYTPQNTRWASPKHQATNNRAQRYLDYKGERWRLCDLAEYAGLNPTTLSSRIDKMGLSVEDSMSKKLNTHTRSRNIYKQKAEELGIHEATLRYRVSKYGWYHLKTLRNSQRIKRMDGTVAVRVSRLLYMKG